MTIDEAQAITAIVATADGGCGDCVNKLLIQLEAKFPEYSWREFIEELGDSD